MNYTPLSDHDQPCDPSIISHLGVWEVCIPVIGIPINAIAIFVIMKLKEYKKSISHWLVLSVFNITIIIVIIIVIIIIIMIIVVVVVVDVIIFTKQKNRNKLIDAETKPLTMLLFLVYF